jgi:hypothetical protein
MQRGREEGGGGEATVFLFNSKVRHPKLKARNAGMPEVFGKTESSASRLKFSELHTVLLQNQQKLASKLLQKNL